MKLAVRVGALTLCFLLGSILAPTAFATLNVNRSDMVAYANSHVCNTDDCRSTTYVSLGNDCTNFISQILRAGGLSDQSSWWYHRNGTPNDVSDDTWTYAWVRVPDWYAHFVTYAPYLGPIQELNKSHAYSPANGSGGDIYIYNWGEGAGLSHLAFSPGFGTYPHRLVSRSPDIYLDSYNSDGDWIDQHSTDRWHAPWNWGYLTEPLATVRANQHFYLIPYNNLITAN